MRSLGLMRSWRDPGNRTLQIRESEHLAAEEMKEDHQLPTSSEACNSLLDAGRR